MDIFDKFVIVFIGLFGCGKLMFLCCFNCMNDMIDIVRVMGFILFDGEDINSKEVDFV